MRTTPHFIVYTWSFNPGRVLNFDRSDNGSFKCHSLVNIMLLTKLFISIPTTDLLPWLWLIWNWGFMSHWGFFLDFVLKNFDAGVTNCQVVMKRQLASLLNGLLWHRRFLEDDTFQLFAFLFGTARSVCDLKA
jgi:hypothetical protein